MLRKEAGATIAERDSFQGAGRAAGLVKVKVKHIEWRGCSCTLLYCGQSEYVLVSLNAQSRVCIRGLAALKCSP